MLSALIPTEHGYPAMPLAGQLAHQRFVHSGPLVLGAAPLKFPTPTMDRDRTVSRRSEPSSRAALIGEQPNPWDVLDRKSTRLNSSHMSISYAVFCLKKKKKKLQQQKNHIKINVHN